MPMRFDKRKAFGQHFLTDQTCIQKIIELVMQDDTKSILEIGPGVGAITNPLLVKIQKQSGRILDIAEIDRDLIKKWQDTAIQNTSIRKVYAGDAVINLPSIFTELRAAGKKYSIVSNLPYSAGTAILVELAKYPELISQMVLMFQKEVAKRVTAAPSTPDRGSLSVLIQNEWNVEECLLVKPQSFQPPPKVDSMVIRLSPKVKPEILLNGTDERQRFDQMLRVAFRQRRKMLRNNFSGDERWGQAFAKSSVAETLRAEQLTFDDWNKIWQAHL
jgi:16S rRNA (adenine1518-N6/adenine1519-N6)-dimethyltransferase